MDPLTVLGRTFGVARTATLVAAGMSPRDVRTAVDAGELRRVRRGVIAAPDARADVVAAARVGGALTALSAARALGIWTPLSSTLDVAIPRQTSRAQPLDADDRALAPGGVRLFWRTPRRESAHPFGIVSVSTAIRHTVEREPRGRALCVIDSALHLGLVDLPGIRGALAGLPRRLEMLADAADGRAESGSETTLRDAMHEARIAVRPQVPIPGTPYTVDLVAGERLIIECDSEAHHGDPAARRHDLERDAVLRRLGYVVLRFDWWQITFDLATVIQTIEAALDHGLHLWPDRISLR